MLSAAPGIASASCAAAGAAQQPLTIVLWPPSTRNPLSCQSPLQCAATSRQAAPRAPEAGQQALLAPREKAPTRGFLAWKVTPAKQQPEVSIHPKTLMTLIKATTSWQELLQLHRQWSSHMNHIHVSAMLTHLAQLQQSQQSRQPNAQQEHEQQQQQLGQQHAPGAAAVNGVHRPPVPGQGLGVQGPGHLMPQGAPRSSSTMQPQQPTDSAGLIAALLQHMVANTLAYENRQIANSMWAVAKLGAATPNLWVSRCLAAARHTLHNSTPQQLANMAYAVAVRPEWLDAIGAARNAWLDRLLAACHSWLPRFQPQELSNLLWAAARIHQHKPLPSSGRAAACLAAALEAACQRAGQLNAQEVSSVLWAAGKLAGQPGLAVGPGHDEQPPPLVPPLPAAAVQQLLRRLQVLTGDMRPQGMSAVMLALPWLGARPPRAWVRGLLDRTAHVLPHCSGRELSNMMLGLAYLGYQPSDQWLACWHQRMLQQLSACNSQELANTAWALCRLQRRPGRAFMASLLMAAARQLQGEVFQPQELSMLIQALSQLRVVPDLAWMQLFCATVHQQLPSLSVAQLATIIWSLARINFKPPHAWLTAALQQLQPQLPQLPPQSLAMVMYGLAIMGHLPEPAWCAAFLAASERRLGAANVHDLASLLWAVAALELRPSAKWVHACMARCVQLLQAQLQAQQQHAAALQQGRAWQAGSDPATSTAVQHTALAMGTSADQASMHASEDASSNQQRGNPSGHDVGSAAQLSPIQVHMGLPRQFVDSFGSNAAQRGGNLKRRARLLAAKCQWSPPTLTRAAWALARMGYAADHPVVRPFLQLASGLDTSFADWKQRRSMHAWLVRDAGVIPGPRPADAASTSTGSGGAHMQTLDAPQAGSNATAHTDSTQSPSMQPSTQHAALHPAQAPNLEYLVLEGILGWSAQRLGANGVAGPGRNTVPRQPHQQGRGAQQQQDLGASSSSSSAGPLQEQAALGNLSSSSAAAVR